MTDVILPAGIVALGPEAAARVSALVRAAEERQTAEADAALETALSVVPWPLRQVVKKVLVA